jgi:hypothetical protein
VPNAALLLLFACAGPPGGDTATSPPAATDGPGDSDATGTTASPPVDPGPSEIALQGELIGAPDAPGEPWVASIAALAPVPPPSASFQLYISRTTSEDGLVGGLLPGLHPDLRSVLDLAIPLEPGAVDGSYVLPSGYADDYPWGEGGRSDVESGLVAGWRGTATVFQPAGADVAVPAAIAVGDSLLIEFGGQGFSSAIALVLDGSGAVTWTNDPDTVADLYAANAQDSASVTLPGDAFPAPGDYVVGFAACVRTLPANLVELEPDLTAIRACRMVYRKLTLE